MFKKKLDPNLPRIDLHEKNLKEAERAVIKVIKMAYQNEKPLVKIITGRGNHANRDGKRGLILRALPKWLENPEIKPLFVLAKKQVGSYLIHIKPTQNITSEVLPTSLTEVKEYKEFKGPDSLAPKKTSLIQHSKYRSEKNELIRALNDPKVNIQTIEAILNTESELINEICNDGTTILMLSAAMNRVDIMELVFLKSPQNRLLKQTRADGVSALMLAVEEGHIESIDFLLKKAPSLLKLRSHNGNSVFQIVRKNERTKLVLDTLYLHLESHKREKGYTNLFREYKERISEFFPRSAKDNKVQLVETSGLIKFRKTHAWFFMDRSIQFLKKLTMPFANLSLIKRQLKQVNNNQVRSLEIMKTLKTYIIKHNTLRHLFLKFNNQNKIKHGKRHKHAVRHQNPAADNKMEQKVGANKGTKIEPIVQHKNLQKIHPKVTLKNLPRKVNTIIFSKSLKQSTEDFPSNSINSNLVSNKRKRRKKK